jgi:hypothetical protein
MRGSSCNQTTHALGLSIVQDRIELHGLNQLGDVVLHGWFPKEAGVSILCRQPHCMIALDAQSVPAVFAKTLEMMGHSIILVAGDESDDVTERTARALAQVAMTAVRQPAPRPSLLGPQIRVPSNPRMA